MTITERPNLEFRQRGVEFRIVQDGKAQGRVLADVLKYDKVDDYRTSFKPGTFTESLADHLPTMVWGHNWLEPIGQWIDADDNGQRMRMLGQLDLDMHDNGQMLVPQAHRAWLQMQKRTVNQFSIGFVRLADQPHREIRGATEIIRGWLDEVSPVVVGSVPGTGIISTRSQNNLQDNVQAQRERRKIFNVPEIRANPTGYNQYKHMTGGKSAPVDPTKNASGGGSGSGNVDHGDVGSILNPGPLPAGVKPTAASIRNHVKKTIEGGGVSLKQTTHSDPVLARVGGGTLNYSVGSTKRVTGTKVTVHPTRSGGFSVSTTFESHGDLLKGRVALAAKGYKLGPAPSPGVRGDGFYIAASK